MPQVTTGAVVRDASSHRADELFRQQQIRTTRHTDRMFAVLMLLQWVAGIAVALVISPHAWVGMESRVHLHVWVALLLGGLITIFPVILAWTQPGKVLTRHVIAVGQMLMSALLIHLTGGRIETHFHVFGSLAILAFYRDWQVLISASIVVVADHLLRGMFWPQSVYGVLAAPVWRSLEHGGWVIFEVTFLIISIRKSLNEMHVVAERQAALEALNDSIECTVAERTTELTREIAERKQTEEALRKSEEQFRQSQKMEAVGRLAGGMAHDFNNLLTVISGHSELMMMQIKSKSLPAESVEEIHSAAQRAAQLTRQLLAFSRKQVLQPKVLDLNDVVLGMEKMARRLIGEDVELRTALKKPLGRITADPGQIEQLIMNLVVNARDAMPRGGRLLIETDDVTLDWDGGAKNRQLEAGDYVMLAITDTGIGMTESVKAHLFEPFFTTKGVGKGTGLGLATCYGIAKQSGGDIRVYSEPDHGTTFRIYFPQTSQLVVTEAPPPEHVPRGGTETLLVIEDDEPVRRLTVSILKNRGYTVHEAGDGIQAMELIMDEHSPRFDLIISDIIMPRMGGRELVENIRFRLPEVKVLFVSGYTDDALADRGVLGPGIAFLEKPFSHKQLAERVRAVLDETSAVVEAVSVSP
jgi:signal transduction histidine kinase/ActR/RegA family two-component response regulator